MTQMTTVEYKDLRGVTNTAGITRAMNKGRKLVGVSSYRKVGRDWVLKVDVKAAKKNIQKGLVVCK